MKVYCMSEKEKSVVSTLSGSSFVPGSHSPLSVYEAIYLGGCMWEELDAWTRVLYACYLHFRRNGWIVKGGTKYGFNFVLYENDPNTSHSSQCVKVVSSVYANTNFWRNEKIRLERVSRSVGKGIIVMYVPEEPPETLDELMNLLKIEEGVQNAQFFLKEEQ